MNDFYNWRDRVPTLRAIVASFLCYLLSLAVIGAFAFL